MLICLSQSHKYEMSGLSKNTSLEKIGFRSLQISEVTPLDAIRLEKLGISSFRAGLCFDR